VWQKNIILHDVTGHFTELPQVAFHAIDQHLTTCIFGSIVEKDIQMLKSVVHCVVPEYPEVIIFPKGFIEFESPPLPPWKF